MMSKFEAIQARLTATFERFEAIFETTLDNEFAVIDIENERSYIVIKNANHFIIKQNDSEKTIDNADLSRLFFIRNAKKIGFIPIDMKNGLVEFGTARCDFILFDENDFCFIEMKLNATSDKKRSIRVNRTESMKQLSHTITFFDEKLSQNYEGLTREAYISTPAFYPRRNASWEQMAVAFMEICGIQLFESNEKICK